MTFSQTQKLAKHICRLLKVTDITFPVGRTSKGNFGIVFNENGDYEMMLDSVPLSTKNVLTDENNIELKRMVEKYLFENDMNIPALEKFSEENPAYVDEVKTSQDYPELHKTIKKIAKKQASKKK